MIILPTSTQISRSHREDFSFLPSLPLFLSFRPFAAVHSPKNDAKWQRTVVLVTMTLKWRRLHVIRWMQVGVNAGVYEILDNLDFTEFESAPSDMKSRRVRWTARRASVLPPRGEFTWATDWLIRSWLQLRFDNFGSTSIRQPFDCNSTALRPFDDIVTTIGTAA